jgi:hypothetical protein
MATRTRANFKTTVDSRFTTNGTGAITGSITNDMFEDVADSVVMFEDLAVSDPIAVSATSATYSDSIGLSNSADTDEKFFRFLWFAGSGVSGNQDITASLICPNDGICTITIYGQGVAADGSAGISVVKIASFRRDGAADPVQIGATTSVHNVEDSGDTPTITIAASTTFIRVSYNSGGAPTYHWTIWADVAITKV